MIYEMTIMIEMQTQNDLVSYKSKILYICKITCLSVKRIKVSQLLKHHLLNVCKSNV